jgi:hypothetical protein
MRVLDMLPPVIRALWGAPRPTAARSRSISSQRAKRVATSGRRQVALGEAVEQLPVALLRRPEIEQERLDLGVVARLVEQREALAAPRFDERADEQPIGLEPGLLHRLQVRLAVPAPRGWRAAPPRASRGGGGCRAPGACG